MICFNPIRLKERKIDVPCGKCYACKMNRRMSWTYRLAMELMQHKDAYFITLTYNDENLPQDNKPKKSDLQTFIKKLRNYGEFKEIKSTVAHVDTETGEITEREKTEMVSQVRYYAIAEHGEIMGRIHYHVLLFGYNEKIQKKRIEELWDKGFVYKGTVTPASIHYVTKDMMKDHTKTKDTFTMMSLKPPIGLNAIKNLTGHKARGDFIVRYNNFKINMPRIYRDKLFNIKEKEKHVQRMLEYSKKAESDFMQYCKDHQITNPFAYLFQMRDAKIRVSDKAMKRRKL